MKPSTNQAEIPENSNSTGFEGFGVCGDTCARAKMCATCAREIAGDEPKATMTDASEIEKLKTALATVAQAMAWHNFGEARSFGEDVPLLTLAEADVLARKTLGMPFEAGDVEKINSQLKAALRWEAVHRSKGLGKP